VTTSLTKQERAVIDAAINFRERARYEPNASTITLECAVDELIKARAAEPPSIDELCEKIKEQHPNKRDGAPARAVLMIKRATHPARHSRSWPASNAAEVGTLDADTIRDTRNAGPYVWKTWADALRALDIEPTWAKELGV
jgi:hypothetical protein